MESSACRPGMQYHIAVLMDGTMRVASALLDQPMEPSGSIAGSSSGGAFRQPEQAAASQAAAIEPEGASLTLPGVFLTSTHPLPMLHEMAL